MKVELYLIQSYIKKNIKMRKLLFNYFEAKQAWKSLPPTRVLHQAGSSAKSNGSFSVKL
ncbi:hypothetical protein CHRY9390_02243 [Chryseobacterium aquaeductus]|uniref:Uncharacterized protein n=1 Tax=Chryseobacterium aquaeductus TaxID=2675056 RepID=A0A9N8QSI9_9FLAO|nr:hypothetical protein CHRY9390_02243 [Chryseobacterium potabilaquae]CAD7810815.1 hypothetical protein CHRY9390_02243 [Chryseobacterium aquaeductus]